jgi:molybdopterin converting factor small subunit
MTVSVRFRGPIAGRVTGGAVEINVQDTVTVAELLSLLIRQDSYLQKIWNSPTEIDRDSMILCNEVDIGVTGGLSSLVREGDIIMIVPLVHGG